MIQFFQHYISPSSPARAKLSIQLHAKGISGGLSTVDDIHKHIGTLEFVNTDQSEPYVINDVREFKSRLGLSPGPRPVTDLREFEELD
jgi:insulysin